MEENLKWINVFNEKFDEFIKDLIQTFPDDKDFKLCKNSFHLLKMVDHTKPVQMFKAYALKYQNQISIRDEQFFMNHDFKEEIESSETNLSLDVLKRVKLYWIDLDAENKQIIWSYLNLLYKLNDKICI
jgi:hypothetical protein